ncbi:hemocytin-like [Ylistrum balloti]|uniref:hemocytin-like n=1 Tax=Ylistrum balloti TaxID=509963 RepID=UPI002905DC52|nr:hemocytin-like [Ylistrum balloti]
MADMDLRTVGVFFACFFGTISAQCADKLVFDSGSTPKTGVKVTTSSEYGANDPNHVYGPSRVFLNAKEEKDASGHTLLGGWSAATLDTKQYVQVEFSTPKDISAVSTQGRNGCCKQWVTKYKVQYSTDCQTWQTLPQDMTGNVDESSVVTQTLPAPITAKCVRINPTAWNHHISMRMDLIGCDVTTTTLPPTTTTQPTTVAVTTQPTTVAVTTQPTTVPVTTQPTTVPVTTQPTTVPVTTQPITTVKPIVSTNSNQGTTVQGSAATAGQSATSLAIAPQKATGSCTDHIVFDPATKQPLNGVVVTSSTEFAAADPTHVYSAARGLLDTVESKDQSGNVLIGAWAAGTLDTSQYLQVEFPTPKTISAVATQGRHGCCKQWVTSYKIQYSTDCNTWTTLPQTFTGNTDEDTVVNNTLTAQVTAKCIRVNPVTWNHHIAMRMDIIGCDSTQTTMASATTTAAAVTSSQPPSQTTSAALTTSLPAKSNTSCGDSLLTSPYGASFTMSASSEKEKIDPTQVYSPDRGVLNQKELLDTNGNLQMGAWSPDTNNVSQYLQVNFSSPVVIRDVTTQGRNGCCQDWVSQYRLEYSTDCVTWLPVGSGAGTTFTGNTDQDTPVTNSLGCVITAKCMRLIPLVWNNNIAVRLDFTGCKIRQSPAGGATTTAPVPVTQSVPQAAVTAQG